MGGCSWEDYLTSDEGESRLWSPQVDFKVLIAWRGLLGKKVDPKIPIFTIFFGLSPGCVLVGVTTTAGHNAPKPQTHQFWPNTILPVFEVCGQSPACVKQPPKPKSQRKHSTFPRIFVVLFSRWPTTKPDRTALTTSFCRYHPCLGALFGVSWWWWWWWWWWCLKYTCNPPSFNWQQLPAPLRFASSHQICVVEMFEILSSSPPPAFWRIKLSSYSSPRVFPVLQLVAKLVGLLSFNTNKPNQKYSSTP